MLTVQYASTINIGVLDGQYLILLLMLQHCGMANTKIKTLGILIRTFRENSIFIFKGTRRCGLMYQRSCTAARAWEQRRVSSHVLNPSADTIWLIFIGHGRWLKGNNPGSFPDSYIGLLRSEWRHWAEVWVREELSGRSSCPGPATSDLVLWVMEWGRMN